MIHLRCLLPGATPPLIQNGPTKFQTIAGLLNLKRQIFLENIMFPELDKTKRISGATSFVFDGDCKYDMILGQDTLHKIGLSLCFEKKEMRRLDSIVTMKTSSFWHTPLSYYWAMDGEDEEAGEFDCLATIKILDAKYGKVEIPDVIAHQHHLSKHQKKLFQLVLEKYNILFDDGLGALPYPNNPITHA